jgi:hypothetical protein
MEPQKKRGEVRCADAIAGDKAGCVKIVEDKPRDPLQI